MLTIYRRHASPCAHTSRRYRKCTCPIWVQGSLRGEYVRRSLDLRSWQAASDLVHQWEASGAVGVERPRVPNVTDAVAHYLKDAKARAWREQSIAKYRRLLEGEFLGFCKERNVAALDRITVSFLVEFRAEKLIRHAPITQLKKIEYLRAFMRFCVDADWISKNSAKAVKLPTVKHAPTLPFEEEEIEQILAQVNTFKGPQKRLRAMILLLRHSGLRIGDAIALERKRIKNGKLFLYTAKTGTPVSIPLPEHVLEELAGIPGERYFWSGKGTLKAAIESYRRRLVVLAERAGVEDAHFHRLRDSFAIGLLQATPPVPIETVSVLLGHASIRVTEKHYSPWVKSRQLALEAAVQSTWKPGKPAKTSAA